MIRKTKQDNQTTERTKKPTNHFGAVLIHTEINKHNKDRSERKSAAKIKKCQIMQCHRHDFLWARFDSVQK